MFYLVNAILFIGAYVIVYRAITSWTKPRPPKLGDRLMQARLYNYNVRRVVR